MDENNKDSNKNTGELVKVNSRFDEEFDDILLKKADIQLALHHGIAQRVLKIDYSSGKINQIQLCKCCNLPCKIEKGVVEEFSCLSANISDLVENIGVGIELYFFFIKFLILTLLIMVGVSSCIQIYYLNDYYLKNFEICSKLQSEICKAALFNNYSNPIYRISEFSLNLTEFLTSNSNLTTGNTNNLTFLDSFPNNERMPVNFSLLNLFCLIILIITNFIFIIIVHNLALLYDIDSVSPGDFTLMISNIPTSITNKQFIFNYLQINELKPVKINLTYNLTEYDELVRNYSKNQEYIREEETKKDKSKLDELNKNQDELVLKMRQLKEKIDKNEFAEFNGVAFVTFEDLGRSDDYLGFFPQNLMDHFFVIIKSFIIFFFSRCYSENEKAIHSKRNSLIVQRAREPEDIIWSNLQYLYSNKILRWIISNCISLILIFFGAIAIFYLNSLQDDSQNKSDSKSLLISIAISIVIQIINFFIKYMLVFLAEFEKHNSQTDFNLSHAKKLALLVFIISGIVPFVTNYLNRSLYTNLVSNVFIIVVVNAGLGPLLFCLPPDYFLKLFRRYVLKSKFEKKEEINIDQKTANEIFENPDIELNLKFAYLGSTILLTFFYAPLLPLVTIISGAGITLLFFIERHHLLKFYKLPAKLSADISVEFFRLFFFAIVIYSTGCIIFVRRSGYEVAGLIVSLILFVLPFNKLAEVSLLPFEEDVVNQTDYKEGSLGFIYDYDRMNPITKEKGIIDLINSYYDSKIITENEKNNFMKTLNTSELFRIYFERVNNIQTEQLESARKSLNQEKKVNNFQKKTFQKFTYFSNNPNYAPKYGNQKWNYPIINNYPVNIGGYNQFPNQNINNMQNRGFSSDFNNQPFVTYNQDVLVNPQLDNQIQGRDNQYRDNNPENVDIEIVNQNNFQPRENEISVSINDEVIVNDPGNINYPPNINNKFGGFGINQGFNSH